MTAPDGAGDPHDLPRLLTFVDAAVAIALTLLVLPLADAAADLPEGGSVTALLADRTGAIYAFLLSFLVIANLWVTQHRVMRPATRADGTTVRLLLLWTLCIVALPFPTALLAPAGDQAATKLLYIGTMVASVLVLTLLQRHLARTPSLTGGRPAAPARSHGWVVAASLTLALVLSLAFPSLSYFPLLLLLVDQPLVDLLRRAAGQLGG